MKVPRGFTVVLALALLALAASAFAGTMAYAAPPTTVGSAQCAIAPDVAQYVLVKWTTTPQAAQCAAKTIAQGTDTKTTAQHVAISDTQKTNANVVAPVEQYRLLAVAYNGSIVDNEVTAVRGSPGIVATATLIADITGAQNAKIAADPLFPSTGGGLDHKAPVATTYGTRGVDTIRC